MKLAPILTKVKGLQLGDTWTESDSVYVIYHKEPSRDKEWFYDVRYVRIDKTTGETSKHADSWFGEEPFLCNR